MLNYLHHVKGIPMDELERRWRFRCFVLEAYSSVTGIMKSAILWPRCTQPGYYHTGKHQYPYCWCCIDYHEGVVSPIMTIIQDYAERTDLPIPEQLADL